MNFYYSKTDFLNYEIAGKGTPLVLLHGLGGSINSWSLVREELEKHFQLILVDLKGFGDSSKPETGYSPQDQADLVVKLVKELKLKEFILCGHSHGGLIALLACFQVKPKKLVLIDAPLFDEELPSFLQPLRNPFLLKMFLAMYPPKARASLLMEKLFYAPEKLPEKIKKRYELFLSTNDSIRVMSESAKAFQINSKQIQSFNTLGIELLLVWGAKDEVVPVAHAEKMHSLVKSELKLIPECGHNPHEEKPTELKNILLNS
ncbi:alpha/beta hydrolase [Candidatus Micrarchaeota archaeon]|nr:alpha/beta hydrolase [Candidatus Micrarchaeota archaeon]